MSDAHSRGVTRNRLHLENSLEDGYWDDVFTEKEYYEDMKAPDDEFTGDMGRCVGEFDYLAVNYSDKVFLYGEVKSTRGDLYKAERQLERAEEFFEEYGWDMVGQTFLERS